MDVIITGRAATEGNVFDVDKMDRWMSDPCVNGIGTSSGGAHFPIWVWVQPDGSIRQFDPGGIEIMPFKSVRYNSSRAQRPPPNYRGE